jgi:YgiT-type zinc finger domain-containing protein
MKCAMCGGSTKKGRVTVSIDTGDGVVVVRNVPARVCSQCGEEWIDDKSAERVEQIVDTAKQHKTQIEVVALT